jgi:glutamate-1-semialdehyde aminotransferase
MEFARGSGALVWDVDGRQYVDWVSGKGAVTLGHGHPAVTRAVTECIARGTLLPGVSQEYEPAAAALAQLVPNTERVVFAKSGSDAVHIALRLARLSRKRDVVLSAGYHGWDDRLLPGAAPEPARGAVIDFGYDLARARRLAEESVGRVAAVLVTPEPAFFGAEQLAACAQLAEELDAVFIMDEVRCGLRLSAGGAHQYFSVAPDIAVFSKGLANGLPLSAVVGRAELLDVAERTFIFGTYYGEALALAAARATLAQYATENVVGQLWARGQQLMTSLNALFEEHRTLAWCVGPPPMPQILFEDAGQEDRFYSEAVKQGVLFFQDDAQCPNIALGAEEVAHTEAACAAVLTDFAPSKRPESPSPCCVQRYAARRMIAPTALEGIDMPRSFLPPN